MWNIIKPVESGLPVSIIAFWDNHTSETSDLVLKSKKIMPQTGKKCLYG